MVVPGQLRVHHCPKVASSSVSEAMVGTGYKAAFVDEHGPEYRWNVTRHPLERLVSCYTFFCLSDQIHKQPGLFALGYRQNMPFMEFLRLAIVRHNDNPHTRFQATYAGPHQFDRLCRIENLSAEWSSLRKRFPFIERDIGWHNRTEHRDWREHYTNPQVRRYAEMVFAADVALYEASDPNPPKE